MTLGQRAGNKSDSRYCGVKTEFSDDLPVLLNFNINGGFDFVVAPVVDPAYRPSLEKSGERRPGALTVGGSDLVLNPAQWSSHVVVGKIGSWIDLDSDDEILRRDSEISLKQELACASHLSLQACLLPTPQGPLCANYARCVDQVLQSSNNMQWWLRIPLRKHEDDDPMDDQSLSFLTNACGYPCLSKRHQKLVTELFRYSVQDLLDTLMQLSTKMYILV